MSSQKILDAIMDEAKRDAAGIVASAVEMAQQSQSAALEAAGERAKKLEADAVRECDEIASRAKQNAVLAARKNTLAARRSVLDRAFAAAGERLAALPDGEYASLVENIVSQNAETGRESVLVPKAHRSRYVKPFIGGKNMIEILNEAAAKRGLKADFKLTDEDGDFSGGLKLIGEKADIDCSFESLLDEWRQNNEAGVYGMLFKKEG